MGRQMSRILEYRERFEQWGTNWSDPEPGEMVVVLEEGKPTMVEFLCPCGCGNRIPIHLEHPDREEHPRFPRWKYTAGPSLEPSVRWTGGCLAHFHITQGKVRFYPDSGG